MSTVTLNDTKYEKREFYSILLRTVLPLLIQSFFMQSLSFISQILVGSLGTDAIAAVGAANKALSIYNSFLYGCCSGSAMFLAQYWGKKDIAGFQKILGVTITVTSSVGVLVGVLVCIFPERILLLFINDRTVIDYGVQYFRTVAPAYILMGITFPLNYCLRSMNRVKVTMISTICSVVMDVICSYMLIFGKFGFPAMGVRGAAIGIDVTRIMEFIVLAVYFRISHNPVMERIRNLFVYTKEFVVTYIRKASTLVANEMMWSMGTTIYFIIYGRSGADALAAMSIMQTLQMLAKIMTGSFCGSSSIIIGNEIGRGDEGRIGRFCGRFHRIALVVGLVSCAGVLAAIQPIQKVYGIAGTDVGSYVRQCMVILSVYIVLNSCNSINVEGIFRSGGDVKYITLMDMGSIWLVGMPVSLLTGLVLKLPVVFIYSAYIVLELYKLPLGYFRYKSGKWLHKLHTMSARVEIRNALEDAEA